MTPVISDLFSGFVEMDDTHIVGQRKNRRLHIRRIKGKKGHGTEMLPIVGLFNRKTGTVFAIVEQKKLVIAFIVRTVRERDRLPGSGICTDCFKMY